MSTPERTVVVQPMVYCTQCGQAVPEDPNHRTFPAPHQCIGSPYLLLKDLADSMLQLMRAGELGLAASVTFRLHKQVTKLRDQQLGRRR